MGSDLYSKAVKISKKTVFVKSNFVRDKRYNYQYFRYRVLRPILKVYTYLLRFPSKNKPWLAPAAIRIISELLNNTMTVLEYGSGNSSVFLSERSKQLISVEHHPEWYEKVKAEFERLGIENVEYHLIEPDEKQETVKEIEVRYKCPYDSENKNYLRYYSFAEGLENESFDMVLIDGRARVECGLRVDEKLKSGGVLILDNSERERYKPLHDKYSKWPSVNTTTGLTDTTFWFKP